MTEIDDASRGVEIIGFDIGHGESALATTSSSATTEPQILEVRGKRSFITAVANHLERGVLIGEEAYAARNPDGLTVGFKSVNLDKPKVREPLKLFARKVFDSLLEKHQIQGDQRSHFVVGVPSGWKEDVREQYAAVLREAGLRNVTLTKESRAAFIQAKESQDIGLTGEQLQGSVLIIDIGSSTTDFTTVVSMREQLEDFGNTNLGASLLDRAILERAMDSYEPPEQKEQMREIIEGEPKWAAKCELACRRAKEKYFSQSPEDVDEPVGEILKLTTRPPMLLDIGLTRRDMEEILSKPILGGLTWPDAFRQELIMTRDRMNDKSPQVVLLTGGASRMDFCLTLCEEVFPAARVVRGAEPEVSIAKGLARAGRIDKKDRAFRQEVDELLTSEVVRQAVDKMLPVLFRSLAKDFTGLIIDRFALPAFQEWREGKITILADLQPTIQVRFSEWLKSREGQDYVTELVIQWFESLGPELEERTTRICRKYGVPSATLSLNSSVIGNNDVRFQNMDTEGFVTGGVVGNLSSWVAYVIITGMLFQLAILLAPAGIVTVPVQIIVWTVSFVLSAVGIHVTEEWVKNNSVPLWMRKLVPPRRIAKKLRKQESQIESEVLAALRDPKVRDTTLDRITDTVRQHLKMAADSVILVIR